MYNHNKAQQSKNRVHISWDILYRSCACETSEDVKYFLNDVNEIKSKLVFIIEVNM